MDSVADAHAGLSELDGKPIPSKGNTNAVRRLSFFQAKSEHGANQSKSPSRSHASGSSSSGSSRDVANLGFSDKITSSSENSSERDSQRAGGRFARLFAKKPAEQMQHSKEKQVAYLLDHCCFSADGNTLYLWKPRETKVAFVPVLEPHAMLHAHVRVRPCGRAYFLAGGSSKYLVVSEASASNYEISVYSNEIQAGGLEPTPLICSLKYPTDSFAISRDDQKVAMCTKQTIKVWDLQARSERDIPVYMPKSRAEMKVESQKLAFSADGNSIIVATRYVHDGHVSIKVWNQQGYLMQSTSFSTTCGVTHDYGLSSAFCDNDLRAAVVTVMASNVDRVFKPFAGSSYSWPAAALERKHFSYKIICAAQSPSGKRYAIATSSHRVFVFSIEWSNIEVTEVLDLRQEQLPLRDGISLACPNEDTVYVFWFDHRFVSMRLAIVSLNDSGSYGDARLEVRSMFENAK